MTLTSTDSGTAPAALPTTLRLGAVHLTVSDLDRSVGWYRRALGLRVHAQDPSAATLGDGTRDLVVLREDPAATPAGARTGLYHYAINYPTPDAFARAAARLAVGRIPIDGATRHPHHDGIYLPDHEGNGVELAWDHTPGLDPDRPHRDGRTRLDLEGLVDRGRRAGVLAHVDTGMRVGHVHLVVGDLDDALAFYRDVLGFDEWGLLGGRMAFLAVGGYHHHLAFNAGWGRGARKGPEGAAGLEHWTIELPTPDDVQDVRRRVVASGRPTEPAAGGFVVRDPWGTAVAVSVPASRTASRGG